MREKKIVLTSIIGIIGNIFLVIIKAFIGFFTKSIAVISDAINNLSDALSSLITIIGTKLAGKKATKKHPMGYGRIEYITTSVIAFIVLYAGITVLIDSIKAIIDPTEANYGTIELILLGVGVIVKVLLGLFFRKRGKNLSSSSLIASGNDALFDSIISLSTIIAAIVYLTTNVSLEAYLGIIISAFIIKSGIEMLIETINFLIGVRVEKTISDQIKEEALKHDDVLGVYDLFIHNYGPDHYYASFHLEVPGDYNVTQFDELTRNLQSSIYEKYKIIVTAIGLYALDLNDPETADIYHQFKNKIDQYEYVLSMHGFNYQKATKTIIFDLVVSFECPKIRDYYNQIQEDLNQEFKDYKVIIVRDIDITD